jgi:hypothetical protein
MELLRAFMDRFFWGQKFSFLYGQHSGVKLLNLIVCVDSSFFEHDY